MNAFQDKLPALKQVVAKILPAGRARQPDGVRAFSAEFRAACAALQQRRDSYKLKVRLAESAHPGLGVESQLKGFWHYAGKSAIFHLYALNAGGIVAPHFIQGKIDNARGKRHFVHRAS